MCMGELVVNYKMAIAHHLLDTAHSVKDHEVARQFVQRAINAMVGPKHRDFKQIGKIVRNPVHGMAGKGVLPDLAALKFAKAIGPSKSAHQSAKRALAAKNLAGLRRHARQAKKHLDAALQRSVPAAIKAIGS